jgi:hypothetical protein
MFMPLKKQDGSGFGAGTVLAGVGHRPVEERQASNPQTGFEQIRK